MSVFQNRVGAFTVPQRDKTLQMLREWVKFKAQFVRQSSHAQQVVHHYVHNKSGRTIPAYGCVQITGTVEHGGGSGTFPATQNCLIGKTPIDDSGENGWYVFNGFDEIPDGQIGICYDGPLVRAKCDNTYQAGDKLSPQVGSFSLTKGSLFIYAGPDDVRDETHKVFVLGGGGGGSQEMIFTIDDVYGVETAASDHCDDKLKDAKPEYKASCVYTSCGSIPQGADENGKFLVKDYLGFLTGREESEVVGKTGLASYMQDCEQYGECEWIITWIDWFRIVQVITNVTMTDDKIIFDRKNVEVWDDCELDPIEIPLTDCESY